MAIRILRGDAYHALRRLRRGEVRCCITSPPYFLQRQYLGEDASWRPLEIGGESTPDAYIRALVDVFSEVRRVLSPDGTFWLNVADMHNAYNGNRGVSKGRLEQRRAGLHRKLPKGHGLVDKSLKNKDLLLLPYRLAAALQADGWVLRQVIQWCKENRMPEPQAKDRPSTWTEPLFLFSQRARYYYDPLGVLDARGRPLGNYWLMEPGSSPDHSAVFPDELPRRCILLGSQPGDTILDPFSGTGTVLAVAARLGRSGIGIDLDPKP